MNSEQLLAQAAAIVGADNMTSPEGALAEAIQRGEWAQSPLGVATPENADQAAELVRLAEAAGAAILPCGSGSRLHVGTPPSMEKPYLLLSFSRMNRVIDFQPDDLTVTVEPGVTLQALQTLLAEKNQMLALDAPLASRTTLGGLVSSNASGFWRPAYGSPRDLLIGLKAVLTAGETIKGGGRVVKNVAGYDVCKLFTGAWGTMGLVVEMNFKVRTRHEEERALVWKAPDLATATKAALQLHHSRLAATYVVATNEIDGSPNLIVGMQGIVSRTAWQAQEFRRQVAEIGFLGGEDLPLETVGALRDLQARLGSEPTLACQIAVVPSEAGALLKEIEASGARVTAHCATGLISVETAPDAVFVRRLKARLPEEAHITWTRLPSVLREHEKIAVWGEPKADFFLHRALKSSIDPRGTFSPGRFLGGI